MRSIKFFLISLCLTAYFLLECVLHVVLIWAPRHVRIAAINRLTFYLMNAFKTIAGLKIIYTGHKDLLKEKGLFIISTHIGYIDGIVLGTLVPGTFTTKQEIRKIPFIGLLIAIAGCIFVDRQKKTHISDYTNLMAERLKHKINVFNFPEGHATDGTKILPFFPSFFDAPLKTRASILPVTIGYEKINGGPIQNRDDVYCYNGKISMLRHLWNILKFKSINISVHIHEKVEVNGYRNYSQGRKFLSDLCLKRLSAYQNLPVRHEDLLPKPSFS